MRTLEWDNMAVKIDGRQIHRLRSADDIVLITPDISQAERMLADFDKACGKIGLRLNLKKTMFMKNGLVSFAPFTLNGTTSSWSKSKENDVDEERIGFVCPIHAQRNEYLRMLQLCLFRSGNQYDERLSSRADQKETSGLESFQEHRGCSEENKEHPTPCPPFRLNGSSCTNVCVRNLVAV
uniref:Reverse transcriptase domain-containing protein n=1 Tax=Angiostrongylus cantonensis TaxID=6313 RepID=A0A0K0CZN3_ANGCA